MTEVSQAEFNSYILPFSESQDDLARAGPGSDTSAARTRFEWRASPKSSPGSNSAIFKKAVRLPPKEDGPASNCAKSMWR
jgi:hypothetical protein